MSYSDYTTCVQKMQAKLELMVTQTFVELANNIANRKMYVMMEEELHCDAMTDHLEPKNCLPIYQPFLTLAQTEIISQSMPILLEEIQQYSESLTLGVERKYDDEAKYQVSVAQATCDQLI